MEVRAVSWSLVHLLELKDPILESSLHIDRAACIRAQVVKLVASCHCLCHFMCDLAVHVINFLLLDVVFVDRDVLVGDCGLLED